MEDAFFFGWRSCVVDMCMHDVCYVALEWDVDCVQAVLSIPSTNACLLGGYAQVHAVVSPEGPQEVPLWDKMALLVQCAPPLQATSH